MMSMMRLVLYAKTHGIDMILYPITYDSLINRARNAAVAMFLTEANATHILFIDADIEFAPEDVIKLFLAEKDVVGAAYPQKWCDFTKYDATKRAPLELCTKMSVHLVETTGAVVRASYVTTGFLLITREVFERLIRAFPDRKYENDIDGYMSANQDMFYDFFCISIHPHTKRLESEDYGFSRLWTSIGGDIFIVPDVSLKHHGWFAYPGNLHRQLTEA
jgi:glycosyltransferase involved in cell wall biosynthesis